jgi:hypothetical protein
MSIPPRPTSRNCSGTRFGRQASRHFVIFSDADPARSRAKAALVDRTHHQLRRCMRRLSIATHDPEQQLIGILFQRHADYQQFASGHDRIPRCLDRRLLRQPQQLDRVLRRRRRPGDPRCHDVARRCSITGRCPARPVLRRGPCGRPNVASDYRTRPTRSTAACGLRKTGCARWSPMPPSRRRSTKPPTCSPTTPECSHATRVPVLVHRRAGDELRDGDAHRCVRS